MLLVIPGIAMNCNEVFKFRNYEYDSYNETYIDRIHLYQDIKHTIIESSGNQIYIHLCINVCQFLWPNYTVDYTKNCLYSRCLYQDRVYHLDYNVNMTRIINEFIRLRERERLSQNVNHSKCHSGTRGLSHILWYHYSVIII